MFRINKKQKIDYFDYFKFKAKYGQGNYGKKEY